MKPDISIIVLKGLKRDMGKKMMERSGKSKLKKDPPKSETKKSNLKKRLEEIRGK